MNDTRLPADKIFALRQTIVDLSETVDTLEQENVLLRAEKERLSAKLAEAHNLARSLLNIKPALTHKPLFDGMAHELMAIRDLTDITKLGGAK